jgi:Leucine-rich repeat (LRR) protein
VNLDSTQVNDEGVKKLIASLPNLTYLGLNNTKVTDTSLEAAAKLGKLTELEIAFTQVTEDGLKKLQIALPKLKIAR